MQVKFLDELDKLEKKRHLEQEREILMKAAKVSSSRSSEFSFAFILNAAIILFPPKPNRVDRRPRIPNSSS